MPWSPWITDQSDYDAPATSLTVIYDARTGERRGVSTHDTAPEVRWSWYFTSDSSYTYNLVMPTVTTLAADWRSRLEPLPYLLRSLERGVDYDVRPNRDPDAWDAFVQYAEGATVIFDRWHIPAGEGDWWAETRGNGTDQPYCPSGRLALSYAPVNALTTTPWPTYGFGTELWSFDRPGFTGAMTSGTRIDGTIASPEVSVTTPAEALSIFMLDTSSDNYAEPFGSFNVTAYTQLSPSIYPRAYVRMPPYRYWIPGTPPLRQRQRDDGLLRSPKRARGARSRQGSIRQRGYL